jgi:hypothetical protein
MCFLFGHKWREEIVKFSPPEEELEEVFDVMKNIYYVEKIACIRCGEPNPNYEK